MTRSVLLEVCALSAYNVCWCGRRIAADEQNDHTLRCQATEKRETLPCHVFPARARDAAADRYHVTDRRAELNARTGSSPHTCR